MFVASGTKLSFVAGGRTLSSAIWWSRGHVLPEPACYLEDRQYPDGIRCFDGDARGQEGVGPCSWRPRTRRASTLELLEGETGEPPSEGYLWKEQGKDSSRERGQHLQSGSLRRWALETPGTKRRPGQHGGVPRPTRRWGWELCAGPTRRLLAGYNGRGGAFEVESLQTFPTAVTGGWLLLGVRTGVVLVGPRMKAVLFPTSTAQRIWEGKAQTRTVLGNEPQRMCGYPGWRSYGSGPCPPGWEAGVIFSSEGGLESGGRCAGWMHVDTPCSRCRGVRYVHASWGPVLGWVCSGKACDLRCGSGIWSGQGCCMSSQGGWTQHAAAAAKSLQSCPTLCDPIDGSPPGSPVPGILQARTLEWVAISFSNAWKWKLKVKSLSLVWLLVNPWTAAHQAPPSMGFSRQEYWSGVPLPSPGRSMVLS